MTSSITLNCLKALSKAGQNATVSNVARIARLDRNAVGRTLKLFEEFGLVSSTTRGRSEIFSPTILADHYLRVVSGDYEACAHRIAGILKKIQSSPFDLVAVGGPLRTALAEVRNILAEDIKKAASTMAATMEKSGIHLTEMTPEQLSALNELRELAFAFKLATKTLKYGSPDWKLATEISQLLELAYGGCPYLRGEELVVALPTTSTTVLLEAARKMLETASEIDKYAQELGLTPVELQNVGTDGRGRPIYRVK